MLKQFQIFRENLDYGNKKLSQRVLYNIISVRNYDSRVCVTRIIKSTGIRIKNYFEIKLKRFP